MTSFQETRLPSAPERGEAMELAGSASCVTTATSMGHREEAAGKQSAPEMGNRKSSALDSGSERGGSTSHTVSAPRLHYAGHKGSCATALSIPLTPGRHTWNPSDVTCKRCLTELRRSLSDEEKSA